MSEPTHILYYQDDAYTLWHPDECGFPQRGPCRTGFNLDLHLAGGWKKLVSGRWYELRYRELELHFDPTQPRENLDHLRRPWADPVKSA